MKAHLKSCHRLLLIPLALASFALSPGAQAVVPPPASGGTSGGVLDFSNMSFVHPQPTITTFDAPGAGTGPGQGTLPFAINPAGTVLGYYIDVGDARHGFLRTRNGAITTFDAPGAGTGPGQGTDRFGVRRAGTVGG